MMSLSTFEDVHNRLLKENNELSERISKNNEAIKKWESLSNLFFDEIVKLYEKYDGDKISSRKEKAC